MQTTIELVLSIYVDDNGTLFCLIYKNGTVEKSLPIDLFYLTYEDEKTAREAADMLFGDLDVRNKIIEKAEKRYKIEKKKKNRFKETDGAGRKLRGVTLKKILEKYATGIRIFRSMTILRTARSIFAERNLVKVYFLPSNVR